MAAPPTNVDVTENRGPQIIISHAILWAGAVSAVVLRFIARRKAGGKLGWDDWLVLFSTAVPFTANIGIALWAVSLGTGKHLILIIKESPQNIPAFLKFIYAAEILYPWIIAPVKASILCLYIRIFGINRPFRYYCFVLIGLTVAWAIALEFGSIFQCTPVADAWNPQSDRSDCVNLQSFLVGTNSPNIVLDFLILTAPLYSIWQLNLSTKRKVFVTLILMLGAGETVFSIVRLIILTHLDTSDATWNYFDAIVWSTVEQSIGIICVCLPTYGPIMPRFLVGKTRQGGSDYYGKRNKHYGTSSSGNERSIHQSDLGRQPAAFGGRMNRTENNASYVPMDDMPPVPRCAGCNKPVQLPIQHPSPRSNASLSRPDPMDTYDDSRHILRTTDMRVERGRAF